MTATEITVKWMDRYLDAKRRFVVWDAWAHLYENDFERTVALVADRNQTHIPEYPSRERLLNVLNARNSAYLEMLEAASQLAKLGLEIAVQQR
jgi:hypothetical protein